MYFHTKNTVAPDLRGDSVKTGESTNHGVRTDPFPAGPGSSFGHKLKMARSRGTALLSAADHVRSIVDHGNTEYEPSWADSGAESTQAAEHGWQRRALRAEDESRHLTERLQAAERQISLLRNTLIDTASLYQVVKDRLEQELALLGSRVGASMSDAHACSLAYDPPGVMIRLPYLTRELRVLFEMMERYYVNFEERHPPKSAEVARAIDQKLNYRGQPGHEPSRTGQTFAAAIRPEQLREVDRRRHSGGSPDGTS